MDSKIKNEQQGRKVGQGLSEGGLILMNCKQMRYYKLGEDGACDMPGELCDRCKEESYKSITCNFTEEELLVLLEAARVCLNNPNCEDEGYISPLFEEMDLSDEYTGPLIEKLNNFMCSDR